MSKRVVFKNIFSVGYIQIANYVFPLITVPVVSRAIGPDKFGIINFANAFVAYFVLFIGYGFDLTATRKIAQAPNDPDVRNRVFSETLFAQGLLFLVSIVMFLFLIYFIPQLREEKLVAIFTFSACFGTVITQNWLFQAMQELSKLAVLNLVSKVLFTVLILMTIHQKSDYIWQPFSVSIASIFVGVASFFWSIKRYHLKLLRVNVLTCLQLLWKEKFYFFSLVIINLYTTTNLFILGLMKDSTQVGFYAAGQKLVTIFQSIISMILIQALFPYIGRAFGESSEKGIDTAQKLLPVAVGLTAACGIVLFFVGPYALVLLYGKAFGPAITVFRILAFTPVIIAFSTIVGIHVMLNMKMDSLFFKSTVIGAVFSLGFNFLFVRHYGFTASAYNLLLTEGLVGVLFYVGLLRKGINIINMKYFNIRNLASQLLSFRK